MIALIDYGAGNLTSVKKALAAIAAEAVVPAAPGDLAEASGVISASRFLIRCSAARRAERGPSPGRRASSWIRRSISGPAWIPWRTTCRA